MTRNYIKISQKDTQIASILGAQRSMYKFGLPWLRIPSSVSGTNVNLSDQRPLVKSASFVDAAEETATDQKFEKSLLIESGPVGEARLDDQA